MPRKAPSPVAFVQMISPLAWNSLNSSRTRVPRRAILEERTSAPVSEMFFETP